MKTVVEYSSVIDSIAIDDIEQEIIDLIKYNDISFYDNIINSKVRLFNVESPFILADNYFDLNDDNNEQLLINTISTKTVIFTGGCQYDIIVKVNSSNLSFVVQGTVEEGYNIFIII